MSVSLRPATPADARALATLAERTFRDTFAAHNSPQNMDVHCRAHYGEALQLAEIASADHVTLVVEAGGLLLRAASSKHSGSGTCTSSGTSRCSRAHRMAVAQGIFEAVGSWQRQHHQQLLPCPPTLLVGSAARSASLS